MRDSNMVMQHGMYFYSKTTTVIVIYRPRLEDTSNNAYSDRANKVIINCSPFDLTVLWNN